MSKTKKKEGPSWPWSYGSWIYNYLCNQCLSPLMLWVRISIKVRCTTLCDQVCQWLATGRWFSPVSSTNKTNRHDITEILLKVALNTINKTKPIRKGVNVVIIFSSPCQRQCELLPSLGVRRLSSVNFSHFNLLLWNPSAKWSETW